MPVCCWWMWIFKTSIHVCNHGLVFSNLVLFLVFLWVIPSVFLPQVLLILFPCYLYIWLFCFVLSILIFYSKIVLLPLHLFNSIVTIPLQPLLHQLLRNISILAGKSSSGSDRGITHFFTAQETHPREGEKKNKEQTNNMGLG